MKRIICFLTAFVMLFTMSVSAADLDFLKESYKSYEGSYEMTFTLNKPADFVDALIGELPVKNFVNVKGLLESVFKASMKAEAKVSISSDCKKIAMGIESTQNIPAEINRNLKLSVDAQSGMWIKLDISDRSKPVYTLTLKQPYMDKYITMDVFEMLKETTPDAADQVFLIYDVLLNNTVIDALQNASVDLIAEYAKVSRSGNTVTVKMDNDGVVKYISGVLDTVQKTVSTVNILKKAASDDAADAADFEEGMAAVRAFMEKAQLFGKDGLTIQYRLDGKYIGAANIDADIALNIGNIMRAAGADDETAKAYDSMNLDFTMHMKESFKNVNRDVKVSMPVLNEENSLSFSDLLNMGGAEPDDTEDADFYIGVESDAGYIPCGVNAAYLGVRDIFDAAYSDSFDIAYNNGTVTVNAKDGKYGFKTVKFTVGASTVNVDGAELALKAPVIELNDKVYVDDFFVKAVFDYDLEWLNFDIFTGILSAGFYNMK